MDENKNLEIHTQEEINGKVKLTPEQELAISSKGLVMVSASAGSGKTHTMLERIIHLIDEGVSLERMLIIVYNEANASELREKIRTKLFEAICDCNDKKEELSMKLSLVNTDSKAKSEEIKKMEQEMDKCSSRIDKYREQLDNIAFSTICTIHAFCRSAMKKHFEVIGVNPDFDILDETSHNVYINKALDKTIDELSVDGDATFREMLYIFESKRTEESIRENIVELYEKIDVQADPQRFLQAIKENLSSREVYDDIVWGKAMDKMKKIEARIYEIYPVVSEYSPSTYKMTFKTRFEDIIDVVPYFESRDAKNISEKFAEISASTPRIAKECPTEIADIARKCNKYAKDLMEEISILYADDEYCNKVFEQNKKYAEKLIEITLRFKENLEAMKAEDNVKSFGDLEHGAVSLINSVNDLGERAVDIGEDYDYVFVDEYQDVNGAQEYVIKHLVKDQAFMVGDVKQSIYGFRLCDPENFLSRQRDYAERSKDDKGVVAPIFFKDNFRSDNAVLRFVNDIFDYAMTAETAGVDYSKEGRFNEVTEAERNEGCVEVHIFESKNNDEKVNAEGLYKPIDHQNPQKYKTAIEREGEFIANKIMELKANSMHEYTIDKKKGKRQLDWSDFAILFRGRNSTSSKIIEVLKQKGIPVDEGSFAKEDDPAEREFINMLSVIDNPRQDYALAGYLLSYLGGYTENEVNTIVLTAADIVEQGNALKENENAQPQQRLDLYDKVIMYANGREDDLADKIKKTLERLNYYRIVGSYMSVRSLVDRIIGDTGYDAYLYSKNEAMGNGFGAYLKSINEDSITLSKYLREYKEGGRETKGKSEGGNRVQVSTMHSYKGLEKPVVFLPCAQLSSKATKDKTIKKSNKNESASFPDLLIDTSGVIGMTYFDIDGRVKDKNTVSNKVTQILACEKEYREEMRLLYVALTRAQKNMYITGTFGANKNNLNYENLKRAHSCEAFEKEECLLDYIVTAMTRGQLTDKDVHLHYASIEASDTKKIEPFYLTTGSKSTFEKELKAEIIKAQEFVYPHSEATKRSMKYTVTQINAEGVERLEATLPIYEDDGDDNILPADAVSESEDDRKVSATTKGTIYHKVMEYIDFSLNTLEDVKSAIDKMVNDGILTAEHREVVSDEEILKVLENPVIKQASKARCYHELPFMMYVPAKDVLEDSDVDDKVLVQGVIDLLIDGKEKIIVDFKYASLYTEDARERYKKQLKLYKMAYKVAFGEEIEKIILLSLKNGKSFEL